MATYEAKSPIAGNWKQIQDPIPNDPLILSWKCFVSPFGILVISAVDLVEGKPQYHISMTDNGKRIAASIVPTILRQFGAEGWDEDNHSPFGKARNFWLPITNDVPLICPCKDNEKPTTEGDYTWRKF